MEETSLQVSCNIILGESLCESVRIARGLMAEANSTEPQSHQSGKGISPAWSRRYADIVLYTPLDG